MVGRDVGTMSAHDSHPLVESSAPCAVLFRVLDAQHPLALPSLHSLDGVEVVSLARGEPIVDRSVPGRLAIRLPDPRMSSSHAELRESSGWRLEDTGSKNGCFVNGERRREAPIRDGDVIELGWTFFLFKESLPLPIGQAPDLDAKARPTRLSTLSPTLARAFQDLGAIAPTQLTLLIRGETGTGKELVARALHQLSGRRGEFVAVNCASLPASLVESELFGYKKGAFSGASRDHPGLVRASDGGTLFLDEVGDMPLPAQAALLRVLQEREVLSLGATRPVAVDLRVCAATHRDMDELVKSGAFRDDLRSRISGFTLELPPLAERREDLGLLVRALLLRLRPDDADRIRFLPAAVRRLFDYEWPRNVRELEKTLERALALAADGVIRPQHLGELTVPRTGVRADDDESHKRELVRLLSAHAGNISAVAREMGKDRVQIRRWIKRWGLSLP